jgi:quercetin dioxygenase-like cupin family protein
MSENDIPNQLAIADLARLAQLTTDRIPAWTHASGQLNINLIVFDAGAGVPQHVNNEVDVLIVGIEGEGYVEIDGTRWSLHPLQAVVIPKGANRSTGSAGGRFAYLTCHRQRAGLWPSVASGA